MGQHQRQGPERQPLLQRVEQNLQDQKHQEEVSEMGLTAAEFIRQQTQRLTQQRDRQQLLIGLMEIKFGSLPSRVHQAIQTIEDLEKLKTFLYRIPTASSLEEMENLLVTVQEARAS